MVSLIEFNLENNPLESPPASVRKQRRRNLCFQKKDLFFNLKVCTLGLLHIMRFLLVESMKEEKRRGLLTEHEINAKYRNTFSYQGSR
jgi:hypothetical protein